MLSLFQSPLCEFIDRMKSRCQDRLDSNRHNTKILIKTMLGYNVFSQMMRLQKSMYTVQYINILEMTVPLQRLHPYQKKQRGVSYLIKAHEVSLFGEHMDVA